MEYLKASLSENLPLAAVQTPQVKIRFASFKGSAWDVRFQMVTETALLTWGRNEEKFFGITTRAERAFR